MSIWFKKNLTIDDVTCDGDVRMMTHLDIQFTQVGDDFLEGTMPVDERTTQPYGLLHGGASCVLAETLGSMAAHYTIDPARYQAVGISITANHLKSATNGVVTGTARPLRLGRKIQVWDISIVNQQDELLCMSRLTVAIVERK